MRIALLAAALLLTGGVAQADPALDALVAAYPDHLASHDGTTLVWKDGTRMKVSDGRTKTFEQMLDDPDIDDQFAIPYPLGEPKKPGTNEDPGRIRYEPLFVKMYGDCRKGEVTKRLKTIPWMPKRGGKAVQVPVELGIRDEFDQSVEVRSGLSAGDRVIVGPSRTIVSGTKVQVMPGPTLRQEGAAGSR